VLVFALCVRLASRLISFSALCSINQFGSCFDLFADPQVLLAPRVGQSANFTPIVNKAPNAGAAQAQTSEPIRRYLRVSVSPKACVVQIWKEVKDAALAI
jgi:hypothetical protein